MSQRDEIYKRWKEVDTAISTLIATGQAASMSAGGGSRSYTRADLKQLIALRADYAAQILALDRGGRKTFQRVRVETRQCQQP